MRKQAKKCVVLLLALSLILSCVQIVPVLAEVSAAEESSVETTKTWDFEDAEQINDFELDKQGPASSQNRAEKDFVIVDGYLYAQEETLYPDNDKSHENAFRKAILAETDLAVKSVSVEIHPESDENQWFSGGIYVGYADEITPNGFWRTDECIFIYLRDKGTSTDEIMLNVSRGKTSGSTNESKTFYNSDINSDGLFYTTTTAQALKLTVDMAGPYLLVKVSLLSDETKYIEQVIDVRKDSSSATTDYTSDVMLGRIGLAAHGYGAKFDNFTVGLDTNMDARTWDFNQAGELNDFELAKFWGSDTDVNKQTQENFKIENNCLYASYEYTSSAENQFKKAILKETEIPVKKVTVDIHPESDEHPVLSGGIYLGYSDTVTQKGSWRTDDCVFVSLRDKGTNTKAIELIVYRGTSSGNTQLKTVTVNNDGAIHSSNDAQSMRMMVEVTGPYVLVTVSLLSDETKYFTAVADVRVNKDGNATSFSSDVLVGRVGLGAWCYGAKFDNFTINGDTFTVGGINDSQIAVSKYGTFPTGADIVDGKYILGWSKNGVDMGATATYKKVADTYEANVVDPAMLGLSSQTAASTTKEGRYDVRFIGSLNEFFNSDTNTYENYKRAGFVFTLDSRYATADKLIIDDDENCVTKTTYNLYSGLNETVNSATETKTPADIYGSDYANYFFAYEITGVSIAEGKSSRTIYARAYLQLENGDIVYGEPSSVTVGDTSKEMDVYLIAGQSNAAGRSAFTTDSLSGQNTAYVNGFSNVLYSGAAYNKTAGNLVTLQPVKAGFGAPDDSGNIIDTMGPEVGMADAFSTYYNETSGNTAGIVKLGACAVSLVNDVTSGKNSYLGNWVSPSYEACLKKQGTLTDEKLTGGMYAMFVEQVIASLQQIREAGYEPNIKGIYWMQGENDREDCQEYVQAFRYFATDIRSDLSTLAGQDLSNMPIIIGEISRTFNSADEQTKNETFIAMQNTLPDFVSNCYIADISDYDVNEMQNGVSVAIGTDRGHYNEADCLAIGKLVGSLMMKKAGVLAE